MNDHVRAPLSRCTAVWASVTTALLALSTWLLPDLAEARDALTGAGLADQPFERLLVWLCSAVALAGACWLWSVITVVTLEAVRGRPHAALPGVPAVVRRAVLAACGVALTGGLAAPALATPGELHQRRTGAPAASISGLPMPDRASGAIPGGAHLARGLSLHDSRLRGNPVVVVRTGDTLWRLAEQALGDGAAWPRIYDLNRDVIGSDPDVIHPDQRLRLPRR
ncbi:MAG: hypothetical protein JWN22_2821 [Nocardioides sp.]|nr:hypothetical protein [Nocardioides sp.]